MHNLKRYNTFGIEAFANKFIEINTHGQLQELCAKENQHVHILGGGSNTLFVNDLDEVWYINILGKTMVKERDGYQLYRVGAGEEWHDLVTYFVEQGLGGIENLALIPGKTGAAPIQNIGAYGVEIGDVLQSVSVIDRANGARLEFHVSECGLGYRQSHFKEKWKGRYIIDSIVIKLTKPGFHEYNTSYGSIKDELEDKEATSIKAVFDAVVKIRQSKLPDPKEIGNGGSFFKNPVITRDQFEARFDSNVPHYAVGSDNVKVPAGWLIDQAGWKGKTIGNVGCYEKQALVIINKGNATGSEVLDFSTKIQASVLEQFGISLEREINAI